VCVVARNLRSDQRSHGAAEIGRIDEERATLLFLTSRDERSGSALENFVKGALVAPSEGPPREEGASVPAHKSDAEGERSLSLSLSRLISRIHKSANLLLPRVFLPFRSVIRPATRIAFASFFPDFLSLFFLPPRALSSSIYVSPSSRARSLSTPLVPTASPLMVSASAVSISHFPCSS